MKENKDRIVIEALKEIVQLNEPNLNFIMGYVQGLAQARAQQQKKGA